MCALTTDSPQLCTGWRCHASILEWPEVAGKSVVDHFGELDIAVLSIDMLTEGIIVGTHGSDVR